MPDPILQASVAVGVDLSPLREGLRKVEGEVASTPGGKVKVGVDASPLQAGLKQASAALIGGAILKQVAFIGGALAKSFNAIVPMIKEMGQSFRPIIELAERFESKLYAKELKQRIESTNNKMLKGLYQGLDVANKISHQIRFAKESAGKLGDIGGAASTVLEKIGLRKKKDFLEAPGVGSLAMGLGGAAGKASTEKAIAKAMGGSKGGGAGAGLLGGLLGGSGLLKLALAGAGIGGAGLLGMKAFHGAASGGAFSSLIGPMKQLQEAAKSLDGIFSAIGDKLWKPFLGLARSIMGVVLPAITSLVSAIGTNLEAALANPDSMLNRFINTIVSVIDTAAMLVRNWDLAWEAIKTAVVVRATNIGEAFTWLGEAGTTVAKYLSDNWRTLMFDAFEAITTGLANLGQNIRDFGKSVYEWITSGFTKPFEFKATGLFEGKAAMQSRELNLPEMKLTDLADKLAPIGQALAAREQARPADVFEAPGKKAKPGEASRNPAEFMGIVDFAKKLQTGALAGDPAKDTAKNTKDAVGFLEKIANGLADAGRISVSTAPD